MNLIQALAELTPEQKQIYASALYTQATKMLAQAQQIWIECGQAPAHYQDEPFVEYLQVNLDFDQLCEDIAESMQVSIH